MTSKPTPAVVEAWACILRLERVLVQRAEERLKAAGFPPLEWYHVLHAVDRAPKGMLRQSGVQDHTRLAQYNVCRLVDRLEAEGLLERRPCRLDGRNNVLVISAKGRALRRAMWPVYASVVEEHLGAHLSGAEAELLVRLLSKVVPP